MNRAELGEVAEFINGAAFKPADWGEEGHRIIRIQNLNDPSKPFNRTTREVADKYRVETGDLLVSWSASLGVFEWQESDTALLNQHIFKVLPNPEKVHQAYLRHMLENALIDMSRHHRGSTMVHVNRKEFLGTTIPLPPLEEQKRIAGILDQADALRRLRTRALDKLNTLGQAIFHEMFGDVSSKTEDRVPLGSLLTFITSGGRGWAKYYSNEGSRFIRSLDVQMNSIGDDEVVFVTPPDNAEAKRTRIAGGDVLLTITGSKIGRVAPVPQELEGAYISQHVAILRPNKSQLSAKFLSYFLSMEQFGQKQIKAKQYGQAKPGLNFEQIRSFELPNVSVEDQQAFFEHLGHIESNCLKVNVAVLAQETLFASLQHRAFRGEL